MTEHEKKLAQVRGKMVQAIRAYLTEYPSSVVRIETPRMVTQMHAKGTDTATIDNMVKCPTCRVLRYRRPEEYPEIRGVRRKAWLG